MSENDFKILLRYHNPQQIFKFPSFDLIHLLDKLTFYILFSEFLLMLK